MEGSVNEAADSQRVPERNSPAQYRSMCCPFQSSSVQSGRSNPEGVRVDVKGWADEIEGLRVTSRG